jgi:hypothetical protein
MADTGKYLHTLQRFLDIQAEKLSMWMKYMLILTTQYLRLSALQCIHSDEGMPTSVLHGQHMETGSMNV